MRGNDRHEVQLTDLLNAMPSVSFADRALIEGAWHFAKRAHEGQVRRSGAEYFQHPATVARYLAEAGADAKTTAAALLHDVIEDTTITAEEIETHFGSEVRFIVEGVTRLSGMKWQGDAAYAEHLRQLLFAASGDIRVLFIKLYDRVHNMQSNHVHNEERRLRKALEAMHVYAPIAEHLGMGQVKRDLEDLAFPYVQPHEHRHVHRIRERAARIREPLAQEVATSLTEALVSQGIHITRTSVHVKGLYRLSSKLKRVDGFISQIEDMCSVRIVVPTTVDCYRALGVVHGTLRSVPGRVRDYIAFPKPNGYQGIHTTVYTGATTTEVQLCTPEMDAQSRNGIMVAARQASQWLSDMSDLCAAIMTANPGDLVNNIANDFFGYRICVFTQQGDAIYLPTGACAVDFAYAIHPVVGDHIAVVRVNGRPVEPVVMLQHGDVVDVVTDALVKPCTAWLPYVKTTRAQLRIRETLCRVG